MPIFPQKPGIAEIEHKDLWGYSRSYRNRVAKSALWRQVDT